MKQKSLLILSIFSAIIAFAFYKELYKGSVLAPKSKTIEFWQYWTGAEREPLENLVKKFNSEKHGFKVKMLTVSMPRKKILMSVAGGVPPDLMHLDGDMVTDFALRNALENLNVIRLRSAMARFIAIYIDMLNINGKQWAMPLMPTCEAMHLNQGLMAKHKLKTPKTLDDIVNAFDKVKFKNDEVAWMPSWPPWVGQFIPVVFGGRWSDGNKITANSAENIEAWTWVQENFATKIPKDKLAAFTEGFRAYQSPDNPFYSGRIAIENNGVWEKNLAGIYSPKLNVTVAPFPGKVKNATYVTVDALAIPRGAKHIKEAKEFINWLLKQENLEYLALAQRKFAPLKNHSEEFFSKHKNPYIRTFINLAQSPNAAHFPQVPFVSRYKREIRNSYNKMLRMELSAKEALDELQEKFQSIDSQPQQ